MKSRPDPTPWSIGQLADRFDLPTHVLRHWEDVGLITPARDAAGRRRYGEPDAYRVAVVVASKRAGMGLDQVRALVDGDAPDRHRVLTEHLADLDRRMVELERSRHLAAHAMECRAHDITHCPHFRAGVQDIVDGTRRGLSVPDAEGDAETGRIRTDAG